MGERKIEELKDKYLATVELETPIYGIIKVNFFLDDKGLIVVIPMFIDGLPVIPPMAAIVLHESVDMLFAGKGSIDKIDLSGKSVALLLGIEPIQLQKLNCYRGH